MTRWTAKRHGIAALLLGLVLLPALSAAARAAGSELSSWDGWVIGESYDAEELLASGEFLGQRKQAYGFEEYVMLIGYSEIESESGPCRTQLALYLTPTGTLAGIVLMPPVGEEHPCPGQLLPSLQRLYSDYWVKDLERSTELNGESVELHGQHYRDGNYWLILASYLDTELAMFGDSAFIRDVGGQLQGAKDDSLRYSGEDRDIGLLFDIAPGMRLDTIEGNVIPMSWDELEVPAVPGYSVAVYVPPYYFEVGGDQHDLNVILYAREDGEVIGAQVLFTEEGIFQQETADWIGAVIAIRRAVLEMYDPSLLIYEKFAFTETESEPGQREVGVIMLRDEEGDSLLLEWLGPELVLSWGNAQFRELLKHDSLQ